VLATVGILAFLRKTLPDRSDEDVRLATELVELTLTQVGSRFSEIPRTSQEISTFADAMADMFSAYLT
jgi:hypothetical protein